MHLRDSLESRAVTEDVWEVKITAPYLTIQDFILNASKVYKNKQFNVNY